MHFTEPLYSNPMIRPIPLLEVTQGYTHNKCAFCNMYKSVRFRPSPSEWVEADIRELAVRNPGATRLELVGANPFCLSFERLDAIMDLINENLPKVSWVGCAGRVTDVRNKTVNELKMLRQKGLAAVWLGVESGDDWTLERMNKGYTSADILEQTARLDEAGISYWMTFLNGAAGTSHSREHAINSAKVFSACNPVLVGCAGLVLFGDTDLAAQAERGEFDPLDERGLLEELKLFVENLECDPVTFMTAHTSPASLNGTGIFGGDGTTFQDHKAEIVSEMESSLTYTDFDRQGQARAMKRSL